ncbi:MAG TPA: tRNA (adenosine(37)-N6)-dimethylallyltransferase MiaA [Candidatus Doudnabacteria bacterium]|nr:tRNA (adenosine(37)-N6)-dimethylallyltransferase MiaA [Candidatus Doudnabacteria bacterium]
MNKPKLVIIVGPTASGKSELAVKLAKKFNGEIISADSRQIYRGLDIGSGKVTGKWVKSKFVYKSIPHYLIDEANPKLQYSAEKFQRKASKIISDILKRGKLPILCGGTMHWIDSVALNQQFPKVKPNLKLRAKLSKLSTDEMFKMLQKLDPDRAGSIDAKNPHRLIRAIEIVKATGKPVSKLIQTSKYDAFWLGIKPPMEVLESKISKRMKSWLKRGMIDEVSSLHKNGLSWKRFESFGLEYKYTAQFLQNKITAEQLEKLSVISIRQYAKRQLTWWKRNKAILWSDSYDELMTLAKKLLK